MSIKSVVQVHPAPQNRLILWQVFLSRLTYKYLGKGSRSLYTGVSRSRCVSVLGVQDGKPFDAFPSVSQLLLIAYQEARSPLLIQLQDR